MNPKRVDNDPSTPEPLVPAGGLQVMALILVAMTLVAVYSNVQRVRRGQIETVTIAPAAPTATPASPAP
ncbi:MAG: hypothetical protein ABI946_09335 [Chthoniobacterales bacterium]